MAEKDISSDLLAKPGSNPSSPEGSQNRASGQAAGAEPKRNERTLDGMERIALQDKVTEALRTCYDPEIPVNIVDLGLVYDCHLTPMNAGSFRADVKMTLTAPGCGMGPMLAQDVQNKLLGLEGVDDVSVELVWDPPWNQSMISEAGKLQLGLM